MKNRNHPVQNGTLNLIAIIGLFIGIIAWPGMTASGKSAARIDLGPAYPTYAGSSNSLLETGAADPFTINPTFPEAQKITVSDGAANDRFGWSSAVSGNTAIVGAYRDDDNASDSGAAYIFVKNAGSWTQQKKLTASDAAANDRFGWSVAISGDTAIIGADRDDNYGSAYIFVRNAGVWTQQQKLTGVGSSFASNFGISVAIENDTAVIGAQTDDDGGVSTAGSAYVFERNAGVWTQQQKLTASDSASIDRFGRSVGISSGTAVIGSVLDDDNGDYSGSAYIFVENAGVWSEQQKLIAGDGAAHDLFGWSVAISGDTVIVGAEDDDNQTGSAYAFVRSGGTWAEQQKLIASDRSYVDRFGHSVGLQGDVAIIGAPLADLGSSFANGAAYIFVRNSAVWTEQQKLIASDGATGDSFGQSVGISDDHAVVGAFDDDSNGSAYIFNSMQTAFTVTKTADTNDGVCDADCSLREAIAAANASATDDTINFASPLFDSAQTIILGGTALTLNNNGKTTIDGPGADLLTISGNNSSRVFYVSSGAEVEINGLTITDGLAPSTYAQYGGALKSSGGNVTLNDSVVSGNSSVNTGGGLSVEFNGRLVLNNTTVSSNVSTNGGGGGIYSNRSELTLNNSTVSGNQALFAGGGIVIDSDINGGPVSLKNSTITGNSGSDSGGMITYRAANIAIIGNTIIAGNSAPTNPDVSGPFNSLGYNLIGSTSGSSGFGAAGDLTGTVALPLDPVLGPLQDNGGPTFTHLPLGGSPAIDAGSNALIPSGSTNDQRGAGFQRIVNSTVDIGAVEVGTPSAVDQTIAFGVLAPMTYGDGTFDVSASASSGLTVSFAASGNCTVAGTTVTILGAGSCTITASQAGDATYNPAPDVDQSFAINKAFLDVTPDDQAIAPGDPDPAFSFSYSGFVNGEDSSVIDVSPTCEVSGAHTAPGSYPITCSGGIDNNYSFNNESGTLSVLYDFVGFLSPVDNLPDINTAKAGQSIPFKWQLPNGQGGFISDLNVVTAIQYTIVACPDQGSIPENPVDADSSGNSGLSYDSGAQQYKFVWKTPKSLSGQCADFYIGLSDGVLHRASFYFK
ncbi:MAG: PxKF domain-containing protein [Acidobacteriota bacterium]|nr:PxKF domain-containing protein [Acidobacteriota bacterium]